MSDFLEVLSFRKDSKGKWRRDNLGYAKASEKGGYDLTLFTLPAPTVFDGNAVYRISVRPQQAKRDDPKPTNAGPAPDAPPQPDLDDEIPF